MNFWKSLVFGGIGGIIGGCVALFFFFLAPFVQSIIPVLVVVNPLTKISSIVDDLFHTGSSVVWGYVGHFCISLLYGNGFGICMNLVKPKRVRTYMLAGILFTIFFTIIGPFLLMPWLMDLPTFILKFDNPPLIALELSIHLAFTFPMVSVYGICVRADRMKIEK